MHYFFTQSATSIEPTLSSGFVPFQVLEDIITGERHEEMEAEGRIQTVCIREEREYRSLSSWMREERGDDGEERR